MTASPKFHHANKNAPGNLLVQSLLIKPALRHAFGSVSAYIHPDAIRLRAESDLPIILCLTHSGWYDGYLASLLNEKVFRRDGYLMMEEANLARYFFFTWAGVFGIDREDVRGALASIEYISGVLKEGPNKLLCIFPQGTMRHPDLRPLKLYSGVAAIVRKVGRCALVPVAVRYDFIMEQAPDAFMRVGAPIIVDAERSPVNARQLTNLLAEALTAAADQLHADVSEYNRAPYRRLMSGRGSINKIWDGVAKAAGRAKKLVVRGGR